MKTLTQQIKALCKAEGIKNSVSSSRSGDHIWVYLKSKASDATVDKIRALSTTVGYGSLMDDTRWYSGTSIEIRYCWEPSAEEFDAYKELIAGYADPNSYHCHEAVRNTLGVSGQNILDRGRRR